MSITHATITQLHKDIAAWHKGINGFYRFDMEELTNQFRGGVDTPVLMLESYSAQLSRNANKTTHWNARDISFLLLDFTGASDDYDKQEEVLSRLEGVALDIISLLEKYRKTPGHWLYGLFDVDSVKLEKFGPWFDNMYGWNILYTLKSNQPLCFEPDKWDFNAVV